MGLLTFKGGIHPDDGKKLSKDKPIVEAKPGKELVYPLSQHIGAPANPIVEIGARVLRGEKIAEAGGFVSAPIYSSVSGTVKAIAPHFTSTGAKVNSIIIENDEQYSGCQQHRHIIGNTQTFHHQHCNKKLSDIMKHSTGNTDTYHTEASSLLQKMHN